MIHEEICTYEVCKLAKEKGFPQQYDSLTHIYGGKDSFNVGIDLKYKKCERTLFDIIEWNPCLNDIAAPTQSLLQRWLREEKGVTICVDIFDDGWFFDISTFYKQDTGIYEVDIPYKSSNVSPVYDTYELALEDALKYALENLV